MNQSTVRPQRKQLLEHKGKKQEGDYFFNQIGNGRAYLNCSDRRKRKDKFLNYEVRGEEQKGAFNRIDKREEK